MYKSFPYCYQKLCAVECNLVCTILRIYLIFTDLQLDMLSSVLPSAMAPSSGLSYQAEPVENSPASAAPALSLSMNELFQRLVETGIIAPKLTEQKKPEEEEKKEPEIIPITFDKPETLKM